MNVTTLVIEPSIEPLFEILHQERRVLERLVYRLSETGLLIDARKDRYLAFSLDDVAAVESQLSEVELLRAILITGLAEQWDVAPGQLTLRAIIRGAAPGHRELLEREFDKLRALTQEIEGLKNDLSIKTRKRLEATRVALSRLA